MFLKLCPPVTISTMYELKEFNFSFHTTITFILFKPVKKTYQGWVASNCMFIISFRKIGHLVPIIPHIPPPRSQLIFIPHYFCSRTFCTNNRVIIELYTAAKYGVRKERVLNSSRVNISNFFPPN
jgi:hypothetical protein